ncbi:MAG: thrombospondin type 3 repeat-containing protein [candidate division Zixibacteria bacterium]|nr:thrombospondin type 3 repeat-containing protein [candidate division Zixibacteria bacterium]
MKAYYLLLTMVIVCMIAGGATAEVNVWADASPQYNPGELPTNTTVFIDIYVEYISLPEPDGHGMPFAIYSPDESIKEVTHVDVGGQSSDGSIILLNGYEPGGFLDLLSTFYFWSWEGNLPDTFVHIGVGAFGGPPPNGSDVRIKVALEIDEEGTICIDSIDHPNDSYDWMWNPENGSPSFGGPYCWTVGYYCVDTDGDGYGDPTTPSSCPPDNCPNAYNPGQEDADDDGIGDVCDNCPSVANEGQEDLDGDGIGYACDDCIDMDNDGYGDPGYVQNTCSDDNCPEVYNPGQTDSDDDGTGDVCDVCPNDPDDDVDQDGVCGDVDNCPNIPNPDQADADGDGIGDFCDLNNVCGDVTGDGQVNLIDLLAIIEFLYNDGPELYCGWK